MKATADICEFKVYARTLPGSFSCTNCKKAAGISRVQNDTCGVRAKLGL